MAKALVSIVMCTYNGALFLEEQLLTLLQQTFFNFELIISDDCSTDGTRAILDKYAAADNRIGVYTNEKNIGYNKNFENAIKRTTGDYICISDQDDIWLPEKIEKLFSLLQENASVMVYHNTFQFTVTPPYEKKINSGVNVLSSSDEADIIFHNSISGHTMLFNKIVLEDNISFPENVYYDWWLAVLALTKGKVSGTNEVLSYHRQHTSNASAKTGHRKFLSLSECEEKIIAYRAFLVIPGIRRNTKKILNQLIEYYSDLPERKFSLPLFKYLLANNRTLLKYKKTGFLYINIFKTCYRMSRIH